MELVWGATIWGLWSCWLLCQLLGAPTLLTRSAAGLLLAELLALAVRSFGCTYGACSVGARAAGSVATLDVPALGCVLVLAATLHAWRRAARARR